MQIKKANIKRLASLSALGAGVLGGTVGTAEASSIVFSGPVNANVGVCPQCGGSAVISGPNGAGGLLLATSFRTNSSGSARLHFVNLYGRAGARGTGFRMLLAAFPQNSKWGTRRTSAGSELVVGQIVSSEGNVSEHSTSFQGADRYLLFRFTGGSLPYAMYGWAELLVSFPNHGLDVDLVDWAYDTSGAQIPAGDTGTPEPSTLVTTGLAALALGARGLRSWRAARKAQI
jgi:hypothetical protein